MTAIDLLRAISIGSWSVAFALYPFCVLRVLLGRPRPRDTIKAATWFVATVCMGFGLRWIVFGGGVAAAGAEYATWCGLYLLSGIAGQHLTWVVWFDE